MLEYLSQVALSSGRDSALLLCRLLRMTTPTPVWPPGARVTISSRVWAGCVFIIPVLNAPSFQFGCLLPVFRQAVAVGQGREALKQKPIRSIAQLSSGDKLEK